MVQQSRTPDEEGSARQAVTGVAERIRRLRDARRFERSELAVRAGVSEAQLASIEGGESAPPLDVLAQLAAALDVALAELFTEAAPGPAAVVVRGDEVPATDLDGMSVQVLTARAVLPGLHAARYRLSPHSSGVRPVRHEGHDWLYVLTGVVRVEFEQESMTLHPGDSVSFSAQVPHHLTAPTTPAEFLAVGSTFPDDAPTRPEPDGSGTSA